MQTPKIVFSRHTTGAPTHVFAPSSLSPLATFLQTDIQESATGKELLSKLSNAQKGMEQNIFTGNAHNLSLAAEGTAVIEATMEEELPTLTLPEATLVTCLEKWIEFLDTPTMLNMVPHLQ
ncbi:hypothetical protein [Desulfogranum japonicum]|uniref:hypothetical protein n=1 Tax=Desulfogranum japonicum TaxID=231447 RepID=UPI0004031333|nr:hypothetical protein [Desulfogranum japonicum]